MQCTHKAYIPIPNGVHWCCAVGLRRQNQMPQITTIFTMGLYYVVTIYDRFGDLISLIGRCIDDNSHFYKRNSH